ncbi:hypothetical protein CRUP_008675, partial [Coryphaenoides rupestris]
RVDFTPQVLEGKPIFVDCYGNLSPLTKSGHQLVFNFYSFKENRLPFNVKIRDVGQEPCGRLSFLNEPKSTKGVPQGVHMQFETSHCQPTGR